MSVVCVTNATIRGVENGSLVDADTVVNCSADDDAYPAANYRWTNHVDGSESTGPQFVLRPNTMYKLTCNASNDFNRPACYAIHYVQFNSKLTCSITPVNHSCNDK